jgi:hypothetical protein
MWCRVMLCYALLFYSKPLCQSTLMTTLMDFFFSFLSFYYSLPSTILPYH